MHRRLQGVESLEQRALLSVAPNPIDQEHANLPAAGLPLNRILVRFDDSTSLASAASMAGDLGGTVIRTLPSVNGAIIQLDTVGDNSQEVVCNALSAWSRYPGVRYAEADSTVTLAATIPNDPSFSELWGMDNTGQSGGKEDADIDAPEAWDLYRGSRSVVVAVIDTGVDYTHPDLAANMWRNLGEIPDNGIDDDGNGWIDDIYGVDTANDDADPMDDHGHGTHTAGTIGAVGDNGIGVAGVNWNVQIMALKFLGPDGGLTSDVIQAIDYMTTMKTRYGVNIVASNNSWGGGGYSQLLYDAIKASNDAGIMFVAAAGNSGWDNDTFPSYPASYDLPGIIAVAATDRNDQLANFSQYGRNSVDLGAPGVEILSTVPSSIYGVDYLAWDGTSMAAPHVTGAVALGMTYDPAASLANIKQQIMSTVDVVPDLVDRTVTGGRLNLLRFLESFNDAPVLAASGPAMLRPVRQGDFANFGTRIGSLINSLGPDAISDPNADALEGIAVIAASTAHGSWEYTTDNGASWRPLGRVSATAARLLAADTATRIRFLPDADYVGTVAPALVFRAWDQTSGVNGGTADVSTNGGRTAFSSATATATITVVPVNFAPRLNLSLPFVLDSIDQTPIDGQAAPNPGTLIAQVLAPGGATAVTDANGDPPGIAVIGADQTNGQWEYWIAGQPDWLALGSPSPSTALLLPADANTLLRFVPRPGFYGGAGIAFRAWDQTIGDPGEIINATEFGGQTAFSSEVGFASIAVQWINAAPVLNPGEPLTMDPGYEDHPVIPGITVSQMLASLAPAPYPIVDFDGDKSPGVGIAVIGADESNGAWWYATDGRTWKSIAGQVSEANALLLNADNDTRLRFVPNPEFNTANPNLTPTIEFRAWDRTSGAEGELANASLNDGSSAFSAATRLASVAVLPVNDPPQFVKGPDQVVFEDSPQQVLAGWAEILPPPEDEAGQTITFDVNVDQPQLFAFGPVVDSTGTLIFTPAPNVFGTANVTVQARDDGGTEHGGLDRSDVQAFTITILGVNDPPEFTAGPDQDVFENAPRQVVPGWASSLSPGPGEVGQRVWFVIDDNSNPELFAEQPAISPDGTLTYRVAPDANGQAWITVSLHDDGGTANGGRSVSDPQIFTIAVTPANGAPVAFDAFLAADWGVPLDFNLDADDGDPGSLEEQSLTYTLTGLPTMGSITSFDPTTGEVTYVPNIGARGVDRFTFRVTDDDTAGLPANLTSNTATVEIRIDPLVQVPVSTRTNVLTLRNVRGQLQLDLIIGKSVRRLFNQPLADVRKLTIRGSAGNPDLLTVDFASGGAFTLADGLMFGGQSAGMDSLVVRGTPRADQFAVESGRISANALSIFHDGVGQIRIDGLAGNDSFAFVAFDAPLRVTDTSGVDTLDFSAWALGSGINLDLGLSKGQAQQVTSAVVPLALVGTFENVVGTPWDDTIRGNAAVNRIDGGDGNDVLYGLRGNDLLFGGNGNDLLYAGAGVDVLVGGLGNDSLYAGSGRSVLIGGAGTDTLQGGANETIFIGGETEYDANDAALAAIAREWGSSRGFSDRVKRLRNGVNANPFVLLGMNTTVFDDLVQDRMIGGRGKEWFLAFGSDSLENFGLGDVLSKVAAAKL